MSTKYQVWGYDTFAREDYLCGTYNTRSEADRMMKKMERRVQGQDASLRDSFYVLQVTDDVDDNVNQQKNINADFDSDFLERIVDDLLQQLRNTTEKGKRIKVEYDCADTDDCFDRIAFTLMSFKNMEQAICVEVQIRGGDSYSGATVSKVYYRMPKADFQYWLNNEYAQKIMCVEVEDLINSFFLDILY